MGKALGVFFVLFGGVFLLEQLGIINDVTLGILWPLLFIALGAWFLASKSVGSQSIKDHIEQSIDDSLKK